LTLSKAAVLSALLATGLFKSFKSSVIPHLKRIALAPGESDLILIARPLIALTSTQVQAPVEVLLFLAAFAAK